ncbi:uncharacterized protein LOC115223621 isoform X1 [Octopus sinensis]|uniref:Uncharacterized protein LOC115223621 isoform X1 n=1 Tax=Octopus sinensis TaxID=2607531 RepID=A0A6P7TFQ7_9MOLL|nr:uncharacterized protein LOC115223621 isoform X2 [Octopus sinensis]XP_029650144.1 uncharacterized protein LOC115223621 isoform X1 [Octopus sinensis]
MQVLKRSRFFPVSLLLVVLLCDVTEAEKGIPFSFTVPTTYSLRVEETEYGKTKLGNYMKYYDHDVHMMSIWRSNKEWVFESLFDFIHNMFVKVEMKLKTRTSVCPVDFNLTVSPKRFDSDFTLKKGGLIDIASPSASLMMNGDYDYTFLGRSTIRGIKCKTWSTKKLIDTDEVVSVNVSFTDSTSWSTVSKLPQVLVRLSLESKTVPQTVIDYSDFNSVIYNRKDKFQPPPGVACQRNGTSIPILPDFFKLKTELIIRQSRETTYFDELYDYKTKRVKFEFHTPSGKTITEVQDFHTGVGYKIDSSGECAMHIMTEAEPDVHISSVNGIKTVKMVNSRYFYVFNSTDFMYEGKRDARGINCDVWTATGDVAGEESIWRYYFASEETTEVGEANAKSSWLVMYEMMIPEQSVHITYNVYGYEEKEPDVWEFNIATCFPGTKQKQISFKVPSSLSDLISVNQKQFKHALIVSIQGYSGVSALRISDIQIDFLEDGIYITAMLLDKAPVKDQTKEPIEETGLDEAYKNIIDRLKYKGFQITLTDLENKQHTFEATFAEQQTTTTTTTTIKAKTSSSSSSLPSLYSSSSISPTSSSSSLKANGRTGYTTGQMIGLGIGMLLTGVLLATISFILYGRLRPRNLATGLLNNENL